MKKKRIYINGRFLDEDIQGGIKRFSIEVCKRIGQMNPEYEFVLLHSKSALTKDEFPGVKFKKVGLLKGLLWEQISLPIHLCFKRGYLLNLCNSMPILKKKNIVVIHDVRLKEEINSGITSNTHKKFDLVVRKAVKRKNLILTDSLFSKNMIVKLYGAKEENISVMRLGCSSFINTSSGNSEFEGKEYYLSVNSISKHKNTNYIYSLARLHPEKQFFIIGRMYDDVANDLPSNVKHFGFVEDSVLQALYSNASGFISPSLYEGFGLTPLEAIYNGCKRIYLSNLDVFREIFDGLASFFDPLDPKSFVFDAKEISKDKRDEIINKYNWENCVIDIMNSIKNRL